MATLYLHCAICGRKQASGLLSAGAWGLLELPAGIERDHPALTGASLRACPQCVARHPEWQREMLVSLGVDPDLPLAASQ